MIFERMKQGAMLALMPSLLVLAGCPGMGSNAMSDGIVVHVAETHGADLQAPARAVRSRAPVVATGGYSEATLEHHVLNDATTRAVSVYRAWVVLDNIALTPCTDLASRLQRVPGAVLDALVSSAEAHAGHGSAPVGGRALDKPNVIDLLAEDGFILPLGDIAAAPGRYCGVQVQVVPLAGEGYGVPAPTAASADDPVTQPSVPDLAGHAFAWRADYCDTFAGVQCVARRTVDADDSGVNAPVAVSLDFAQPLVVGDSTREASVVIGIAYSAWLQGIDASQLVGDRSARERLMHNIVASLHVYQSGYGELPANPGD